LGADDRIGYFPGWQKALQFRAFLRVQKGIYQQVFISMNDVIMDIPCIS
jgi:hypothetical protein